MKLAFAVLFAVALCPQLAVAGGTWQGKVVDDTSGKAVAAARVCAGYPGRVDAACTKSGADGAFAVSYPKSASAAKVYALYVEPPKGWLYFPQVRQRTVPGRVEARLVPRFFHLTGVVVGAETGKPLPGAEVIAFRPGAIIKRVKADGAGRFTIGPVDAWLNPVAQFNTYGVAPGEILAPQKADPPLTESVIGVGAAAAGHTKVECVYDEKWKVMAPALRRKASATAAIHTEVTIRLPAAKPGAPKPRPADLIRVTVVGAP